MKMYIDLTHVMNDKTAVYPGDPATTLVPHSKLESEGYCDYLLTTGTHAGTHIDAPMHMIEGGQGLEAYGPVRFFGPGIYVDAKDGFDLEKIKTLGITSDHIVLFNTGAYYRFYDADYYESFAVLPDTVVEYLASVRPKMVGVDTGSADNAEGFPVHKGLLGADILIIENLANLDQLEGKQFDVVAFPIRLENDGAPARVVAIIQE